MVIKFIPLKLAKAWNLNV